MFQEWKHITINNVFKTKINKLHLNIVHLCCSKWYPTPCMPLFFLLHNRAHLKSSLTFVIMTSKWIPCRGYLLFSMGYLMPQYIPSMNCTMSRTVMKKSDFVFIYRNTKYATYSSIQLFKKLQTSLARLHSSLIYYQLSAVSILQLFCIAFTSNLSISLI